MEDTQCLATWKLDRKTTCLLNANLSLSGPLRARKKNYLTSESRVVYVPLEKFKRFAPVSIGDVFVVLHDEKSINGSVIRVCTRDEEAKAKHKALRKRAATVSV